MVLQGRRLSARFHADVRTELAAHGVRQLQAVGSLMV